jgi:hypothetical protein
MSRIERRSGESAAIDVPLPDPLAMNRVAFHFRIIESHTMEWYREVRISGVEQYGMTGSSEAQMQTVVSRKPRFRLGWKGNGSHANEKPRCS